MTDYRSIAAAALLAATAGPVWADAAAGKLKARPCTVCHGALGLSTAPNTPNLAGQPEGYLTEQLTDFRSGKRTNAVMSVMAKSLSDEDIRDLAAWFSSVQIEVKER